MRMKGDVRDVKETPPAIASFENGRRESEGKKHGEPLERETRNSKKTDPTYSSFFH